VQYPNFDRRRFVALGVYALAFSPVVARAQAIDFMGGGSGGQSPQSPKDFLPYRLVKVPALYQHRVVELLEFTCPYCRQINTGAQTWGASLPKPFVFEQMPIVFDKTSAEIAAVYYTAVFANPALKNDIVSSMFHAVQDLNENPADPRTYVKAAAAAGVTEAAFSRASQDAKGRAAYIQRAAAFARAVQPRATPTFVVNGKAVDVQDTGGDYQKLFQLLNGLVSESIGHNREAR
jgi:hypothetical protein